ncbi:YveK family protein [Clostridium sp.]|uniref:YveK family protein n=1 Tax=Clostridium sp. TaxID=1506 RepID=UPI002FC66768
MEERTFEIQEILYAIKKRYKILILTTILCAGVAGIYAHFRMSTSYTATIKIFAGKSEEIKGQYSQGELNSYAALTSTYIQLIKTDDFMNKVIEKAGLKMHPAQLVGGVAFKTEENTPILNISYTSSSPEIAKTVVETIASEFSTGVREIITNTYTKVLDGVKVYPIVPNKKKVVTVGVIAGLIIGIGLIFVIDYLDNTVKSKSELEKILPVPVLGELPFDNEKTTKST